MLSGSSEKCETHQPPTTRHSQDKSPSKFSKESAIRGSFSCKVRNQGRPNGWLMTWKVCKKALGSKLGVQPRISVMENDHGSTSKSGYSQRFESVGCVSKKCRDEMGFAECPHYKSSFWQEFLRHMLQHGHRIIEIPKARIEDLEQSCQKSSKKSVKDTKVRRSTNRKKRLPGDSKCPFHPLVGGHLTPWKGHLTIPKRSLWITRFTTFHHSEACTTRSYFAPLWKWSTSSCTNFTCGKPKRKTMGKQPPVRHSIPLPLPSPQRKH